MAPRENQTSIVNPSLFSRLADGGVIKCRLYRKTNLLEKAYPTFYLHNETDDAFILAARKRKKSKYVNYLISTSPDDLSKDSKHYVAKLKANFQRTTFVLMDARGYQKGTENKGLKELACVNYSKSALPREMKVSIPSLTIDPETEDVSKDILADTEAGNTSRLQFLRNKTPRWNEATQSHCLNFGGRVTMPSIKNFQLIRDGDDTNIIMQFGRCGPDNFTLDARYPLTVVEAFAIALTTFDAYDST
ncbi:uncharacterized protein BJ171DRAFT_443703 [Polychytrium aggregatum]|uniref:uncharacterized protein n=1 Tax=Polychytrium aggregatum TaxID=110093 RepID=UPI0022FE023D|nr:uncharacterized protein BJ171DRAFT_443703 [Polychytrium aggregatum]KAI9203139.1 hypothetical protein BJ171DRAFT_443703 [Polychytrium aggregatum]